MSKRRDGARVRHNKGPWKDSVQVQRRKFAEERQAAYDKLSKEQKIAKLDAGRFVATKQRAKLNA